MRTANARLVQLVLMAAIGTGLMACGSPNSPDAHGADAGDERSDAASDTGRVDTITMPDVPATTDALDSADDVGVDVRDAGAESGFDADVDSGADAGADTGSDAGGDAGHTTGADQPGYACPTTGTVVSVDVGDSSAVATNKINTAAAGATICIRGYHRLNATATLRNNQHVIGVSGTNAALSGAVALATASHWHAAGTGIWYYDGPEVPATETLQSNWAMGMAAGFPVAIHADDVFYNDQRMMRVMALAQVPDSGPLPPGEALYPTTMGIEEGRFWYDGTSSPHRIYVNRDPTAAGVNLEIATLGTVVGGAGTDVRIDNLTVEKAVDTALNAGTNWQITDTTVRFAHHIGLGFPNGTDDTHRAVITRTLITNNGQYGIATTNNNWVTFQDCELSWNNITNFRTSNVYWAAGSSKFWATAGTSITAPGIEVLNMNSHHNVGAGLWFDGHNQYVVVRGGRYHHNEGSGIFYEISCNVEISGVETDHNGMPIMNTDQPDAVSSGIHVSHSNDANVHNNIVHDNPLGIVLTWASHGGMTGRCFTTTNANDVSDAMRDSTVHDNTIYMCAGTHSGASLVSFSLSSRNDFFSSNHYHVANSTGSFWRDTSMLGWTGWTTTANQDMGSAMPLTSCTYP